MNIENMTSKELSDELSNHGINMHFNTKRDKLVDALNKVAETNADVTILLENTAGQKIQ